LIGLAIALVCLIAMLRSVAGGVAPMCMGGHQGHGLEEAEQLRLQVRVLREEVDRLKTVR
jgi:hypothetical protein